MSARGSAEDVDPLIDVWTTDWQRHMICHAGAKQAWLDIEPLVMRRQDGSVPVNDLDAPHYSERYPDIIRRAMRIAVSAEIISLGDIADAVDFNEEGRRTALRVLHALDELPPETVRSISDVLRPKESPRLEYEYMTEAQMLGKIRRLVKKAKPVTRAIAPGVLEPLGRAGYGVYLGVDENGDVVVEPVRNFAGHSALRVG